jgi:hypothetical protein
MYKAVHRISAEEILILSPAWRGRAAELRPLTQDDLLVCQGCRQAVRLKAGAHKRPHFAHKHLQGCSYGAESARILTARALLYDWLEERFAGPVDAEWKPEGVLLPRPVDCLVRGPGGSFALWIVDSTLNLETRQQLLAAFSGLNLGVIWVLLSNLLRPDPNHPDWILLSPSERDFLRQTPYDEIGKENQLLDRDFGSTLYFLDVERESMLIFRSLERVHPPNVFSGRRQDCELQGLSASPGGEFVLPGEERELGASRAARTRQVERVRRWLEPAPRAGLIQAGFAEMQEEPTAGKAALPARRSPSARSSEVESVTCIFCGKLTQNWWTAWSEEGQRLGKCRDCLELGLG